MNPTRGSGCATRPVRAQEGISLFVSMILLAAITILALAGARMTLLELTMAGNDQKRITAFDMAESAIDAMYEDRASIIEFNSDVGHVSCTANATSGCDLQSITLPADTFGGSDKAWAVRTGESALVCPPAFLEVSCTDAKAAFFELRSQHDARLSDGGNASVTQGILSILPDQN